MSVDKIEKLEQQFYEQQKLLWKIEWVLENIERSIVNAISIKDVVITQQEKHKVTEARLIDLEKEIREMTWDVQDLEWRLDTMSESQKALANKRITILKDKIANKRTDSDSVALMWIKKYGESIIKEL